MNKLQWIELLGLQIELLKKDAVEQGQDAMIVSDHSGVRSPHSSQI